MKKKKCQLIVYLRFLPMFVGIASFFGVVFVVKFYLFSNNSGPQLTSKRALAVYVEDEEGGYKANSDGFFPTDGYVLNTELSGCYNGGILTQNLETKSINLSVDGTDQCYAYFDKTESISIIFEIVGGTFADNVRRVTKTVEVKRGESFVITEDIIPTPIPDTGYTYGFWSRNPLNYTITEDSAFTYNCVQSVPLPTDPITPTS